ncbi:MAG: response regulator [Bacteroidota bacterium]
MRFFQAIVFTICIFTSFNLTAQGEIKNYSIAQTALLIDSLENSITSADNLKNANAIFNLSVLYKSIDLLQSKKYAFKYLNLNDSILSINKRNIIYGVLTQVYEEQGNLDSSFYYLSLQSSFLNESFAERNEMLRTQYLGNTVSENDSNNLFGLSKIQIILLIIAAIILIMAFVYFLNLKRQLEKATATKNHELEIANTKLKEFNDSVTNGVRNNTEKIAHELEKSNATIIELRKSLKKAEDSNYLKNTFLGSMSHQIRTPLSGIMGFSDMLETELAVLGNEELFDYAKNIRESGSKLMSLITNIFDISNIEANILELNIVECDANDVIKDIEKESMFKAKEKGIIYKTKLGAGLPKINADINNLSKVLNIIIDNAIRYTSKGFVTISSTKNAENTVTIRIADKGQGIDAETLSMLLESFDNKKHGSLLTYQNSGLGLILAHRLIDLMNGNMDITSKIGIGTEVNITLPSAVEINNTHGEVSQIAQSTSIVSAPELGMVKIFIVEDDRMNRLVLEKMLKKSGEIVTAVDGADTLKKLEKASKSGKLFDVMLFDINLPQPWDGIKLMHEVKKKFPAYKNIPFIAQTAYAMAHDKDTYLDAGFNDYIAKPINKTELLTIIQKQLELFS